MIMMMVVMTDMARYKYAFQGFDATRHVRTSMREVDISHKHAREVAKAINGLDVESAREYLIAVVRGERAIAFGRYKGQVGHRSDPGMMAGRYPQKTANQFIKALDSLEANAGYQGFDVDRLRLINVTVHKGVVVRRIIPRARGTATPNNNVRTHIEMVAKEV